MGHKYEKWKTINSASSEKEGSEGVVQKLLENRGIKTKKQKVAFFNPIHPSKIDILNKKELKKLIDRLKKAKEKKEQVLVYGDYDADGVCATAIMWETLDAIGIKTTPYIPNRFKDGYGINTSVVSNLNSQLSTLNLVITVDNGIVANDEIEKITKTGVDVVVTDHHQKNKTIPKCSAVIHSTKVCGSAIAWLVAKEILKSFKVAKKNLKNGDGLEMAGIGTISDVMPLLNENRSFALHGIKQLQDTVRPGLRKLFQDAGIVPENIGGYEIGYLIAPRLNAMGRLAEGMDSLRLLCTRSPKNAIELSKKLSKTNLQRQKIVEEVYEHALGNIKQIEKDSIIILAHEDYHEGVVGLAASRLVEKFYKPAIVISKGKKISKASARSISGFSIIDALREHENLLHKVGGHTMAAGFSIKTEILDEFVNTLRLKVNKSIDQNIFDKTLKIDMPINFGLINWSLTEKLQDFEPTGMGNPNPTFMTKGVEIFEAKAIGKDQKHLKLTLSKSNRIFSAIAFGMGELATQHSPKDKIDIVYSIDVNEWNGNRDIQLKIRDILS